MRGFAEDIRDCYGVAVDACLHAPHDYGDDRNHHAHVMTTTRVVGPEGLGVKTRQLDVSSTASVEIEAIRESWASRVNDALELAQVPERVDHRSYARQGVEMEPTVKMGHASSAIERRAQREQDAIGEEHRPVTVRGQINELIRETRSLGVYVERGREWLREMGDRLRQGSELAVHGMASLVQGAARTMRAELARGASAGAVPAIDGQSRQREQTPGHDQERQAQEARDRLRQQRGHDGPDIGGFGR